MSADQRRAVSVAGVAHALHDGYTDLVYIMLPLWQTEFALSYAALGLLRSVLVGAMASLQIPAGLAAERFGAGAILAIGTALAGLGFCLRRRQRRLRHAARRAADLRHRFEHAASDRLRAGRARLRRAALAQGARHL